MDAETKSSDCIKIAALGDIMLDREVGKHYFNKPEDFILEDIAEQLRDCDLVIANLENPVGLNGQPHPKQDPHVAFRCHPDTLQTLKNLQVDVVTLANNHLLDYGEETLLDTLKHLDNINIKHVGGGKDYEQANKPAIFEIKNKKIALFPSVMVYSASTEKAKTGKPGVADYKISKLLSAIKKHKEDGYIVLVTIHWGIEYCFYPIPYQRRQAQKMIDAGASVIIGHGPHYPQGVENYKNGQIVHSLGNFIFDEPYNYAGKSYIYKSDINIAGKVTHNKIIPVNIINHLPVLDKKGDDSRTAYIVNNLHIAYSRKSKKFWRKINSRWFSDIIWRVNTMKSIKFALLPPVSFYFTIGFENIFKKFNLNNLKWLIKTVSNRLLHYRFKKQGL